GDKVAFQTGATDCTVDAFPGEIEVMNADGSGLVRLTTGCDARISPDGTKIAFQPGPDERDVIGTTPGSKPVVLDPIGNNGGSNGCGSQPDSNHVSECSSPEHP